MSVFFEYFVAADDQAAASVIDKPGSLGGAMLPGIEPVVLVGCLEELLTGRPFEDILDDPRAGVPVAERDGGEVLVVTLSDPLIDALAEANDARLAEVAIPWSQVEEFSGAATPSDLVPLLRSLASLARSARQAGHALYCRVSV